MPSIIEYLESFNRKERFFLVGEALGESTSYIDSHPGLLQASEWRTEASPSRCF